MESQGQLEQQQAEENHPRRLLAPHQTLGVGGREAELKLNRPAIDQVAIAEFSRLFNPLPRHRHRGLGLGQQDKRMAFAPVDGKVPIPYPGFSHLQIHRAASDDKWKMIQARRLSSRPSIPPMKLNDHQRPRGT